MRAGLRGRAAALRGVALAAAVTAAVAAGGCSSSPAPPVVRTDPVLQLFNDTARLEFDQERPVEAAASYATALDRAREMDDPAAITTAAYNLAIVRTVLADYPAAAAALDEAQHEAIRASIDPTNILLVRARVDLLLARPADAAALADQVLRRPGQTAAAALQAHAIKGLAACRGGDSGGAARELAAARSQQAGVHSASIDAIVLGLSGEVSLLNKNYPAAAADFDHQADLARKSNDFRTMRHALAKAGDAYRRAAQREPAADRLYRAARAAVAAGDPDATRLAADAVTAATAAQDPALIQLTAALAGRLPH
jgi:hypothetical protein